MYFIELENNQMQKLAFGQIAQIINQTQKIDL